MKLGIFGDIHFTSRGPSKRIDSFFETQMEKFSQGFSIFKEHHCSHIFQPGDLFDSHTVSNEVKATIIRFLKEYFTSGYGLLFVSGQHDISGHSLHTLKNSPLAVLQAAKVGVLLDLEPTKINCLSDGKVIQVYGASYGEPIPEPKNESAYNILVIHKMIGDRELFPGQELTKPNQFLRNHPKYNLVICGDYHYRFSSQYQGRTIINAGCLVRKTISRNDLEHKPSVAIFDTDTNEIKFIELKVRPIEEVFDLSLSIKNELNKIDTKKFLEAVKENMLHTKKDKGFTWKTILREVLEERHPNDSVRKILDDCLEEVQK